MRDIPSPRPVLENALLLSNAPELPKTLLSREAYLIGGDIADGFTQRAQQAGENAGLTTLQLIGSATIAAGISAMNAAGGRYATSAKVFAAGLGAVAGGDCIRRIVPTVSAMYDTALNPEHYLENRTRVAENIGAACFDYPLMAIGGLIGSVTYAPKFQAFSRADLFDSGLKTDRIPEISKSSSRTQQAVIEFKVKPDQLVVQTLKAGTDWVGPQANSSVVEFQKRAEQLDSDAYQFIMQNNLEKYILTGHPRPDTPIAQRAWNLVAKMQQDTTFKPILKDTLEAKAVLESECNENWAKTQTIMQNLTGLHFDKHFNVYVTHPAQWMAHSYGDGNIVISSIADKATVPNADIIRIWHEVLHNLIPNRFVGPDKFDVGHAVIELLANNQLRVELNGGNLEPLYGHEFLAKGRQYLLPSWREYVAKQGPKNISQYIDEAALLIEAMPKNMR